MAKKRVNKGLVAALTAGAMVLTIGLVGLASIQAAKRDPEIFATKAREMEAVGKPEELMRAADFYRNAYNIRKDPNYVIGSARCEFAVGDIGKALAMLREAFTLDPNEPSVPAYALEMLWRLRDDMPAAYSVMREHSDQLLAVDPNNVLGLVARAESANVLSTQDPNLTPQATEALALAVELAPLDPRVSVTAVRRDLQQLQDALNAVRSGRTDAQAMVDRLSASCIERLQASIQAHPKAVEPVLELARVFEGLQRHADAIEMLEKACAQQPAEPLFLQRLANIAVRKARMLRQQPDHNPAQVTALVEKARAAAERCIQIEPMIFDSYIALANCRLILLPDEGVLTPEQAKDVEQTLAIYRSGLETTIRRQSLAAVLSDINQTRGQMISIAFENAVQYLLRAGDDATRESAMKQMQYFVEAAVTQYPTAWRTSLLEGEYYLRRGETQKSIAAFKKLEDQSAREPLLSGATRHARERLSGLLEQAGEPGLAMQYVDQVIQSYTTDRQPVPPPVAALEVRLLLRLDQHQRALNAVERHLRAMPDNVDLKRLRADALVKLDRHDEATKIVRELGATGDAAEARVAEVRILAAQEKYDEAVPILTQLLDADPNAQQATMLYAAIMSKAGRGEEGAAYLRRLRERVTSTDWQRMLDTYATMLAVTDPAQRDEHLLGIIRAIPNEAQRDVELFSFYSTRNMLAEARQVLDRIAASRPNDVRVRQQQFVIALRAQDFTRAGELALQLKQSNADGASGRLFFGELYLAQRRFAEAYTEFAAASRELPTDSSIKVRMAQCLLVQNPPRRDEALTLLRDAVAADPTSFVTNKLLYVVYEDMGRRNEGAEYLRQAMRLNPNDEFVKTRRQYIDEENDPRSGISTREKLRASEPQNLDNLVRLIELYARVYRDKATDPLAKPGLMTRAGECLKIVGAADEPPTGAAIAAAELYLATGQHAEGAAWLRALAEKRKGPERLPARVVLSRFLERSNDIAAAQTELIDLVQTAGTMGATPEESSQLAFAAGMELIEFYHRTRQLPAMIETAQKLAQGESNPDRLRQLRASVVQALIRGEEFTRAAEALEQYNREFPNEARGRLLRAQLLLARPESTPERRVSAVQEARELLTVLVRDGGGADPLVALYLRGAASLELARYHNQRALLGEARQDLLNAKQMNPTALNLAHRSSLVQFYETTGDYPLAAAELREMLELRPDDSELLARLLQMYLAADQPKQAQQYVAERAVRDPNNPRWPKQLAQLLIDAGEPGAAVRSLYEARKLGEAAGAPDPEVLANLLMALNATNRAAEAVTVFESAAPAQLSAITRAHAAFAYASTQQPAKAAEQVEQALAAGARTESSDELRATLRQAIRFMPFTDLNAMLVRVLENTPNEAGALTLQNLFSVFLLEQRTQKESIEAQRLNADVIARAKPGSSQHLGALLIGAQIDSARSEYDAARKKLEQILEFDQFYIEAVNNLAYLLVDRLNRPADALPYADRLQTLLARVRQLRMAEPETQSALLDTLGWVYYRNERLAPAEAALVEAVRLAPRQAVAWYHLGLVQARLGRGDEARRSIMRARDLATEIGATNLAQDYEKALQELPR